jgi:hypothetical protein
MPRVKATDVGSVGMLAQAAFGVERGALVQIALDAVRRQVARVGIVLVDLPDITERPKPGASAV